ncbi:hypothetical protein K470DRAFT_156458 [Piedraia hortae CBS 480.64]|uniref:General stress protein FMN-binding split barrel domain-containing protein n=1 Tax=Piedraia hortae CBS 480.64 TaxID=1314780 RepID=A0A6A7C6F6_9PEZI|nr:hypothetical protein K470DRAFT_156458 [Piedraia hortae CBS 480.64]
MSYSNTNTGNQPADPYTAKNLQEPPLKEKIDDLVKFVDKCKFCMMTTRTANGQLVSRCMALAAKEGNGVDYIFHANSESGKTDDLNAHSEVNLGFLNSSGEWASISGLAVVISDREKIRKYYSPSLKAWIGDLGDGKHDGGPDDPRIVTIEVNSKSIQYAVSSKSIIGGAIDLAKGVATGETPQLHKLRKIDESELNQVRSA